MRPLSMPLPLRTTIVWGEFLNVQPLPWVYGRCAVTPIAYNAAKTEWCVADHAIAGVDSVTVADTDTAFIWRNSSDKTGHPITLIELAAAPKDNGAVAVNLRGAMNEATGELLENPADIARDLLRRAGIVLPAADWADFRRQCQQAGLTVGGSLNQIITIRAALDDLLASLGAVWSGGARGWARLWPLN
jgi:hypothetical protein